MKIYVVDTDIAGFLQNGHPAVTARVDSLSEEDWVATTIVTFGEDLSGWLPDCRRAPNGKARAKAYDRLSQGLDFYREMICLPFNDQASVVFEQLRSRKIRIGTNDLAIAAITLSVNGVLVTRNQVDFERVPNLTIEDWTK